MNKSRIVVAAFAFMSLSQIAAAGEPQVAHMVYFALAKDTPQNQAALVKACNKWLSGHEGAIYFSAGVIAADLKRDVNDREFDVALHLVFADKAAHDRYQTHPRHLAFIKENKRLWSGVRVFDSYIQVDSSKPRPGNKTRCVLHSTLSARCPRRGRKGS